MPAGFDSIGTKTRKGWEMKRGKKRAGPRACGDGEWRGLGRKAPPVKTEKPKKKDERR